MTLSLGLPQRRPVLHDVRGPMPDISTEFETPVHGERSAGAVGPL